MPLNHVVLIGNSVPGVSPFCSRAMTFGDFTESPFGFTDTLFGQWRRRGQCSQLHLGGSVSLRLGQRAFDLRPDAKRVAVTPPAPGTKRDRVTSILNFFDELRGLAPAERG
jgi:hypothetical protein